MKLLTVHQRKQLSAVIIFHLDMKAQADALVHKRSNCLRFFLFAHIGTKEGAP